jgi:AraC-like DNA-binding protein
MKDSYHPTRTILVVDDEPNTLEMHARIVQAQASTNRVLKAHNGKEADGDLTPRGCRSDLTGFTDARDGWFSGIGNDARDGKRAKNSCHRGYGQKFNRSRYGPLKPGRYDGIKQRMFSSEETISHINAALENKRRLSAEAQRLVRIAMAYLHENYAEALSRQDIAQHVGISEDHLTFCFRQELGTTPIEYLQRYRINQSKRLLKETGQTITEIAQNVGFSDSGYFGRIFRRETGMNPEVVPPLLNNSNLIIG